MLRIHLKNTLASLVTTGRNRKRESNMDSLYRTIGYTFRSPDLLRKALTHRSSIQNGTSRDASNERLEFLGDSILGMVVSGMLYHRYPDKSEGQLTITKSYLVSRERLASHAAEIKLGKYLILGTGEDRSGGRERESILSDAYEALIGALFLDGGLEHARAFIETHSLKDVKYLEKKTVCQNYKSLLLEYMQGTGEQVPDYEVCRVTGPDHNKEFTVEVRVRGKVLGSGKGSTKKKAEQEAARYAAEHLGLNLVE